MRQDFSLKHIRESVEASLKRLQTDYLDLYQLHSPPASVLENDGVFELLEKLKQQGKIRFYGVSVANGHNDIENFKLFLSFGVPRLNGGLIC